MITASRRILSSHRSLPLCLWLLVAIIATPIRGIGDWRDIIPATLLPLGLTFCAYHLKASRRFIAALITLATILVTTLLARNLVQNSLAFETLSFFAILGIEIATLLLLLKHAFKKEFAPRIDRILSAFGGYLLLAFMWNGLYILIQLHQPHAFVNTLTNEAPSYQTLFYYSMVTLTTQGYGDILPQTTLARFCAGFQGIIGTFYIAVLVATLINQSTTKDETPT